MAQLFPGAVTTFALACIYFTAFEVPTTTLVSTADFVLSRWTEAKTAHQLFLVGVCIGAGMFIHGLHWSVLGFLEHRYHRVTESPWHARRLFVQVVAAPAQAVAEVMFMFFGAKNIYEAEMEENTPRIHQDLMKQFEFLQDFYLYPAQFFAHTSYALLAILSSVTVFITVHGFTWKRVSIWLVTWLAIGVFFVVARIQFRSLFTAETELKKNSELLFAVAVPLGGTDE